MQEQLGHAKILITNFHAFLLRESVRRLKVDEGAFRSNGDRGQFKESPDQMVRRVCRELGGKKNIIVLNDEAHHCYRRKPDGEEEPLSRAMNGPKPRQREEEARVWISGLEAVKAKIGVKAIYDLSATPFFLKGSGWPRSHALPLGGLGFFAD